MRSLFALAVTLSLTLAFAFPIAPARQDTPEALKILEYNIETAYTKFTIPCPKKSCSSEADESLVFELQINPVADSLNSDVLLNGHTLDLLWDERPHYIAINSGLLVANSSSAVAHSVSYSVYSQLSTLGPEDESATQHFRFEIQSIDTVMVDGLHFDVYSRRLRHVSSGGNLGVDCVVNSQDFASSFALPEKSAESDRESTAMSHSDDESFDVEDELESLRSLETKAMELHALIVAKKVAISTHMREHRDHVPLRHLLGECDGLICAAHVLAQRICDKFGMLTEPATGYAQVQSSYLQHTAMFHDEREKTSRNCTKIKGFALGQQMPSKHANGTLNVPLTVTKNNSSMEYPFRDVGSPPNPLVIAAQMVASILGITALCAFIRRNCVSVRRRVERAADKEERCNRRAYRKAARRAEMRRQWDNFVNAISCFRATPEPSIEDYEEKRALILQDAFLEQLDDLDQAEKGEIMEAEIRELRFAQEIVAGLVRVDDDRVGFVVPVHDPPPPMVPLPYASDSRSRTSTYTLPSYTSDILPDYSSQPQTLGGSSIDGSVVGSFTHYSPASSSDGEGRGTPPSTSSGGRTGYTPTSSILEMSPRASQETLRTRQSKDL
ncbi:hypothetical protein LTR08_000039 [Meristemomyces frigidus]|nr:hypothetical protein LTR08_000039 [Meristemomyces frigidus]